MVIPGLGGFIGSPVRAEVQAVTKTINPPGKKISFNAQLQRNDGLLIHHIVLSEGIGYEAAEPEVQQFVKSCKLRLEQSGLVMFPEVGKLLADNEGTISFQPTPGRNLLQESFGLKPVHYRQIFQAVNVPVEQPENAPLQAERNRPGKTRRLARAYGISIAAMLAIGIFIAQDIYLKPLALENFGFFKPQTIWGNTNESPKTHQADIVAEPIQAGSLEITGTLETETAPVIEEMPTPVETVAPIVENTPEPVASAPTAATTPHITEINNGSIEVGYYIVLGAYSSQKNANKFIKEQKGASGLVVIPSGKLFRVAVPAGSVAADAYQQLEKQRQQENPAAWLVYNQK